MFRILQVAALDNDRPGPQLEDLPGGFLQILFSGQFTTQQKLRLLEVGGDKGREWEEFVFHSVQGFIPDKAIASRTDHDGVNHKAFDFELSGLLSDQSDDFD